MSNFKLLFQPKWRNILERYSDQVRLEVYDAIFSYAETGVEPKLRPLAMMAFLFIKEEIDYARMRYEQKSRAGKKGMAARWGHGSIREDHPVQVSVDPGEEHHLVPMREDAPVEVEHPSPIMETVENNNLQTKGQEDGETKDTSFRSKGSVDPEVGMIMQAWNRICVPAGLPAVSKVDKKRVRRVKAAFQAVGVPEGNRLGYAENLFRKVVESPFLTGHNNNGWRASIDWVFKDMNLIKILEGNYNGYRAESNNNGGCARSDAGRALWRESELDRREELRREIMRQGGGYESIPVDDRRGISVI